MTSKNSNSNTNEQSIQILINYTIEQLKSLKDYTEMSLPKNAPPDMKKRLDEIKELTNTAIKNLETPTLRLAFVGVTSSGKSTIVNALTGHRIMPMETAEMSAGIVKIHHDSSKTDKMRLHLDAPIQDNNNNNNNNNNNTITGSKRPWAPIDQNDCTQDNDIYKPLADCMQSYHDNRSTIKNLHAPNAEIWCNTLLGADKNLLQLPEGVQLELLDLPGIKEVDDSVNLKTVQQTLGKNVLTLVINYTETEEKRLNKILDDIRRIIDSFSGDTKTLLFVLNKIDLWNKSDHSLQSKIDSLAERIQNELNLDEKPLILPLKAQSFMLPQISLGQINKNNRSEDESLMNLSESLAKFSLENLKERWYRRELTGPCSELYYEIKEVLIKDSNATINLHDGDVLENNVKEIKSVLQEEGRVETILKAALEESGFASYLGALRSRIEKYFPRLVIQPVIGRLINTARQYAIDMKGECKYYLEQSVKKLDQWMENIEKTHKDVKDGLDRIQSKIKTEVDIIAQKLSSKGANVASDRQTLMNYLKGSVEIDNDKCQFLNSVEDIFTIVDKKIQHSASTNILDPVEKFLEGKMDPGSLESELKENGVSATNSKEIVPFFVKMQEHFREHKHPIKWKLNEKNEEEITQIVDDYSHCLAVLPSVLGDFFRFELQIQAKQFENTLKDAVGKIRKEIVKSLANMISDSDISNSIVPEFSYIIQKVDIQFDASKLPISSSALSSSVDTQTITTYRDRTWGEWFGNIFGRYTPRYVAVHKQEQYITLDLGTIKEYRDEMEKLIKDAKDCIMDAISVWFRDGSDRVIKTVTEKTDETLKRHKSVCQQQLQEAKDVKHETKKEWNNFIASLDLITRREPNQDDNQEQKEENGTVIGSIQSVMEKGVDGIPQKKTPSIPPTPVDKITPIVPKLPGQRRLD